MDAGDIAVLTLALGWLVLVLFLGWVLVRLGRVLQATEVLVSGVADRTVPLLGEVTTTVTHVNAELQRVDAITANVQTLTTNVAGLSTLFGATLGGPLIKVAAFSYGVRRAATKRARSDVERRVKDEIKAERKGRR